MDDDETRTAATGGEEPEHRSGWGDSPTTSSIYPEFESRQRPSQPPGGVWNSQGSWPGRNPYQGSTAQSTPPQAPAPRKRRINWIAPLIILLAAIVAFALVMYFTQNKGSDASAPASSGATSSSSSVSGQTSTTPSTQSTAALPGGTTSCQVPDSPESTLSDPAHAVITSGAFSCQFVDDAVANVQQYVQGNPAATNFTISANSQEFSTTYPFSCTRQNHLSTCTGQGRKGALVFAVQDNAN